jgi:hypothetical protein
VEQIAKTLARAIEEKNTGEQLRLFLLIDTFAKEENTFDQLFQFSKGIKEHIYGNTDYTLKMPVLTRTPDAGGISILTLPIPKTLRGKIKQGISDINKEILDLVKGAKEKILKALHLNDLGLANIPEEVFQLKQLELLNLQGNNLDYIPTAISQLYNLRILDFSKNRLKKLPREIIQRSQLKRILLKNNQLSQLPVGISKLKNLEFLDLSDNQLTQLPEELLEFELDFIWTESPTILDKGIILTNNPFKTPPVEIVKQGKEAVKKYFGEVKKERKIDIAGLWRTGNIYRVTISPTGNEGIFHITWSKLETNTHDSFEQSASEITPEEVEWLWKDKRNQLRIGEKLFRFLDGDSRYLQLALNETSNRGESLQIHLNNCRETEGWPFELLAKDGSFLLPNRMHLVRTVSDWKSARDITPQNRPLKMLFMACSPFDVEPELDFEREEETLFQVTSDLALDMEVEDSGSLEGLRWQLEREQYDVVHLSGHSVIDEHGRPFFIMEDETGRRHNVGPEYMWQESLIENPPRLLFLSGSGFRETSGSGASISFARKLVENYHVPAVLDWGRPVSNQQAIYAAKMIYRELSRGKSIIDALQRARFQLIENFSTSSYPAWPLLRLFSRGEPLNAIVTKNQKKQPLHMQIKHIFLKKSRMKVLSEGIVGRRRQLQKSLRVLIHDHDKIGVLLHGTGGLGKSCLAGKICERLSKNTIIIVHGKLNAITLMEALNDSFITLQDEKGQQILSQKEIMTKKLAMLCATSFKERNYLILLDDFDQNLEGATEGLPGELLPVAADLLKTLLHYLPFRGKMTQLIITCRYLFTLTYQASDLVKERLGMVCLTSFQPVEQHKKVRQLKHIFNYPDQGMLYQLMTAGRGNPRLMEWLYILVSEMSVSEVQLLVEAVKDKQEVFIRSHMMRELLRLEMVNCNTCMMVNRNTSVMVSRNTSVVVSGNA